VVQAVNLYAVIVVVLGLDMKKRVRLYHLFAWSKSRLLSLCFLACRLLIRPLTAVPAVITAITVGAAGPDAYGGAELSVVNFCLSLLVAI
jgi:hypothetical protein